jgi:hypothetical protein
MTQTFILTERPSRWCEGASGLEANGGETIMVRPSACAETDLQLFFEVSYTIPWLFVFAFSEKLSLRVQMMSQNSDGSMKVLVKAT